MTTRPRILLIGGNPKHFHAATDLDIEVVYVQFPEDYKAEYGPLVTGAVLADYTDWDTFRPLVLAAYKTWGFSHVVSLTEPGLDPAGRVNDLLGLPGPSYEVSHRFTDKNLMRRRLAEVAPPDVPIIGTAIVTGRDSLIEFGGQYGYPFIVKPTQGTASYGVHKVTKESEIDSVWTAICRRRNDSSHPLTSVYDLDEYIMEEWVDGVLYSAEAFSFNGKHTVLAITEAVTLRGTMVHVGHVVPARLKPELEATVATMTTGFLDAMEYPNGPSHTEFKMSTKRGPVIIESQNRIGGALINEMVHQVYGVDMHALTMQWPHRLTQPIDIRPVADGGAASWLVVAQPGEITEINGIDDVKADPTTLAVDLPIAPGDIVRSLDGSWDGLGHVAARGPDANAAVENCRTKVDDIQIRTAPLDEAQAA
jgi:hypothetical protein